MPRPGPSDLLTAGLAAAVAVRAAPGDGPWPTVAARSVLPWSVPLGVAVAGAGLARGRWARGSVAAALTGALAGWSWPDRGGRHGEAVPPHDAWRLLTTNMLFVHSEPGALAAEVMRQDADVVLVQEVVPEAVEPLLAGGLSRYPHRYAVPVREGLGGLAVSRYPLLQARQHWVDRMLLLDVVVDLPRGPVRLWSVHTTSPTTTARGRAWRRELDRLPGLRTGPEPLIVAGDFNATRQHAAFRRMVDRAGLRDAFEVAGRGLGATFPVGGRIPVPVMRLDHVLVDRSVPVAGCRTVALPGSDHLALVADLS